MIIVLTPTTHGIDAMPFNRPAEVAHINSLDHLEALLGDCLYDHQLVQLNAGFDAIADLDPDMFDLLLEN